MERARSSRLAGSIAVATLLAVILTGCGLSAASPVPPDAAGAATPAAPKGVAATQDGAATTTPVQVPRLSDLAPGTVIATGEFSDRGVTGRIEIKANGADHGFDITLTGMDPVPPAGSSLELNALPPTASDAELNQGFSYYRYDPLSQAPDQTYSTPTSGYGGFETNDPRYMRTAVIWAAPPGTPIGLGNVVATAALTWDLPNMSPGPKLVDQGPTEGARGKVTLADDGAPVSYRIAWGDTANGIAGRFGITTKDLEWLNPDRTGRLILADITLNLSPESRGLRW